jgi:hypothetical protein
MARDLMKERARAQLLGQRAKLLTSQERIKKSLQENRIRLKSITTRRRAS